MKKIRAGSNIIGYPMPVTLVGSIVDDKANFMAVSWVSRMNSKPQLMTISVNKKHHTSKGILQHQEFSVCTPGEGLIVKTDYCGVVSGKKEDKSGLFTLFYGTLKHAPMIAECPVCLECSLYKKVDLPDHYLFIGKIEESYCDENCLTDGKPDIKKITPFMLSLPDRRYWAVGAEIGKAYKIGLSFESGNREG